MAVSDSLLPPTWLAVLLAVLTISLVVMAMLCLSCRDRWPSVIHERRPTNQYIPQNSFRLVHPHQHTTRDHTLAHTFSPEVCPSISSTGDESNRSYIIPLGEENRPENTSDDYIIVLDDPPSASSRGSGAATEGDYVNLKNSQDLSQDLSQEDPEGMNYVNVATPSPDDSDSDGGNYVNQ